VSKLDGRASPGSGGFHEKELDLGTRKKENTSRLILKCANALFHERGFAATTLEDIAGKAGILKQTVLRYFGSKDALALAFGQVALDKFRTGLLDPARKTTVLEYRRYFVDASAQEVQKTLACRGDCLFDFLE
jgi:AcrR family transcriptional regulator